jgi:ferritin
MLSKEMEKRLNDQLREEFYSAWYYLSIAAWCDANDYPGGAHFFKKQYEEEVGHAMRIYHYLTEVDGKPVIPALDQPPAEFESLQQVFEKALEHEKHITRCISELMDLAIKEKDHATAAFLQWYVNEQVEEEATMKNILAQIRMVGTDSRGLFLVDRELAKRE